VNAISRFFIVGAVALLAMGCGGSDNSTTTLPSLYANAWTGTWSGPLANDSGTLSFTITSDGSLSGTMTRTGGLSGTISGIVNGTGKLTATAAFTTGGNFIISGQMVLNSGTLSGDFNYDWLGGQYAGTFSETASSS
jgi:hypothetical protein